MKYLLKKLLKRRIWNKLLLERLSEPVHLNLVSIFVLLFGSFKQKVAFDLVIRPQHAYGILESALQAKAIGIEKISIIEFGVASGSGLLNMVDISRRVTNQTGVKIDIYGFDTGKGMPKPVDFRDHPELYNHGDFPMNREILENELNDRATLIFGDIGDSIKGFQALLGSTPAPIGFVSIDVDYYSSAVEALRVFDFPSEYYLPITRVYFDDVSLLPHNSLCGELLAIREFNQRNSQRIIEHHRFFERYRIFKNAHWLGQLYFLHVMDHPTRNTLATHGKPRVIENPYLTYQGNQEQFERK